MLGTMLGVEDISSHSNKDHIGGTSEFRTRDKQWCLYIRYCHITDYLKTQWLKTAIFPSLPQELSRWLGGSVSQWHLIMSVAGWLRRSADFEWTLPSTLDKTTELTELCCSGLSYSSRLACSCSHGEGKGAIEKAKVSLASWDQTQSCILHIYFFQFY